MLFILKQDYYKDIADDIEEWFDTSKYDENDKRPLPTGKNKKLIGKFKDELDGKTMKEFVAFRAKTYAYLMLDDTEHKRAKGTKKCVIKRELMFENYKDSLFNNKVIMRSQLRFKSDLDNVYTEEINNIALNSNDDKRLQTFDGVTTYPYGTNVFKLCENEMMIVRDLFVESYADCPFYVEKKITTKIIKYK